MPHVYPPARQCYSVEWGQHAARLAGPEAGVEGIHGALPKCTAGPSPRRHLAGHRPRGDRIVAARQLVGAPGHRLYGRIPSQPALGTRKIPRRLLVDFRGRDHLRRMSALAPDRTAHPRPCGLDPRHDAGGRLRRGRAADGIGGGNRGVRAGVTRPPGPMGNPAGQIQ